MRAAIAIGELVRSSLGLHGMKKLIVDKKGDVKVTADGFTVIKSIQVGNPISKIMVEAAETHDNEVGDGTKSMLIIAGELLKNAEKLLDMGLSPDLIISGYRRACDKAIQIMTKTSIPIRRQDTDILRDLAMTSIYSKDLGLAGQHIADISIKAVENIFEAGPKSNQTTDMENVLENVQFIRKSGRSIIETRLIRGTILEKSVLNGNMPKKVENAKILLLESPLEFEKKEFYAEIETTPGLVKAFADEENRLRDMRVGKIAKSGANVIICQKGIDLKTQDSLAKHGILGVHWVDKQDMEKAAKATGGKIVINIHSLTSKDLGFSGIVEERTIDGDKMIFIEDCKDPKSISILIRAGLDKAADEVERALKDALRVVASIYLDNRAVGGGGAFEMELARRLRPYAMKFDSKEQLAIEAFAEALEIIPKLLAENVGLDQTEIKLMLRSEHARDSGLWMGINMLSRKVEDALNCGLIEPYIIKKRVLENATEVASMIIRTGHIISSPK